MAETINLVDTFTAGGEVVFDFVAQTRADAAIADPASATVEVVVSELPENGGAVIFRASSAPEVQLSDAGTSTFQIAPSSANLALLTAGWLYQVDVWVTTSADGVLHQLTGLLRLRDAPAPS